MWTKLVETIGGDLRAQAAEALTTRTGLPHQPHDLLYSSWPKAWGSTAGPFGGIGGQAITTFQCEAFEGPGGETVVFVGGRLWRVVDRFAVQAFVGEAEFPK